MADITLSRTLIAQLIALPEHQLWAEYDAQADVLYISFRKPQQANDSLLADDGHIHHYHDGVLVGITVLNASAQRADDAP